VLAREAGVRAVWGAFAANHSLFLIYLFISGNKIIDIVKK
jgi:hypothetical protein